MKDYYLQNQKSTIKMTRLVKGKTAKSALRAFLKKNYPAKYKITEASYMGDVDYEVWSNCEFHFFHVEMSK